MLRRFLKLLIPLLLVAAATLWWAKTSLEHWATTPLDLKAALTFELKKNTSLGELGNDLVAAGLIDSSSHFRVWVRGFSDFRRFQAGLYRFEGQVTPSSLSKTFISGKIYEPIVVEYVIPEGFSGRMILNRLAAHNVGSLSELQALWTNKALLGELKVPSTSFEGFFYPSTYRFTKQINAKQAITEAVRLFWRELPANYAADVQRVGLTLKDAVTFASLIEIETRIEDERPMVSEVIWRRLKNREPIGIDAALIYGIKDYKGDIKTAHLKDAKNLYNTRIHRGLPPTPIGSPAKASLKAVLNPTNEGYYYYVRDIDTVDRHFFSRTHAEHERYVAKLVAKTRKTQPPKTKTKP